MAKDTDRLVPMAPVRDADLRVLPTGLSLPAPQRTTRVAELRRLAQGGYYASESMMDLVARRLLASGDL
jgi:hypothetical protein